MTHAEDQLRALNTEINSTSTKAILLTEEKNSALEVITEGDLKIKLMSLGTIIDDQIDTYRSLIKTLARIKKIQRAHTLGHNEIMREIIDAEKTIGIFLGLLLKTLKRQRRSLQGKSWVRLMLAHWLLRRTHEASRQEKFISLFKTFNAHYQTEIHLCQQYNHKMKELQSNMQNNKEILDRAALLQNDKELQALLLEAERLSKADDKKALGKTRKKIRDYLQRKLGRNAFGKIYIDNAGWVMKNVTPITAFSPITGTNIAIQVGVIAVSVAQYTNVCYTRRVNAKMERLAA